MPECPVCERTFPQSSIQRHVNECLDQQLNGTRETPASPPPAPRPAVRRRSTSPPLRRIAEVAQSAEPLSSVRNRAPTPPARIPIPKKTEKPKPKEDSSATKKTTTEVSAEEVDELLNAIRIRDPSDNTAATPTTETPSPAKEAQTAKKAADAWIPAETEYAEITGDIYVRILNVHLPRSAALFASTPSPYIDVSFEKKQFTTAAPCSVVQEKGAAVCMYEDEEFFFEVPSYFGGSTLRLAVYERGIFANTPCGAAEITATEILHGQLAQYRSVGVEMAVNKTGQLAVRETGYADTFTPSDPAYTQWTQPGVCPTTLQLTLPLVGSAGGTVNVQIEFLLNSVQKRLGPRGMFPIHRAAAGGFVKLLRYYWTRGSVPKIGNLTSCTKDNVRPISLAALGSTAAHARCVSFIMHALNNDVEDDGVARSSSRLFKKHAASGATCLAMYNSSLTRNMGLTDADISGSTAKPHIVHAAARHASAQVLCLLLMPDAASTPKTNVILRSKDLEGRNPFLNAAAFGNVAVMDALIKIYKDPMVPKVDSNGFDAVMLAASAGSVEAVKFLLANKFPIDGRSTSRASVLHAAAGVQDDAKASEIIELLASAGATPSVDAKGNRPLHYAVRSGNTTAARKLVELTKDSPSAGDHLDCSAYEVALNRSAEGSPEKRSAWTELLAYFDSQMTKDQIQAIRFKVTSNATAQSAAILVSPMKTTSSKDVETAAPEINQPVAVLAKPPMLGDTVKHSSNGGVVKSVSIWDDDVAEDDGYAYEDDEMPPAPMLARATSIGGVIAPPDPLSLVRQRSVEVYNVEEVVEMQTRMLQDVSSLLKVPLASAGTMLKVYRWDAQALTDAYFANAAAVTEKCGVSSTDYAALLVKYREGIARATASAADSKTAKPKYKLTGGRLVTEPASTPEEKDFCPACMEEVEVWRLVSLGCDHVMCSTCWRHHCDALIKEHGKDVLAKGRCPDPSCKISIPEEYWRELAAPSTFETYHKFVLHTFVPLSGQVVWCPNPKCTKALRYRHARSDLICVCGLRFCVSCQLEAHSPSTCEEYHQWKDDSEGLQDVLTMRVLMENYKKCPKCGVYMERTQGCNHITCKCRHQWCFMCKGDWTTHGSATGGYFRCNIYENAKSKKQLDWEGYSAEERAKYLGDANQSRAKAFEETKAKVKTQEDGMEAAEHKLHVTKKAASDPILLLRKHGVKVAAAEAAATTKKQTKKGLAADKEGPPSAALLSFRQMLMDGITSMAQRMTGRLPAESPTAADVSVGGAGAIAEITAESVDPLIMHMIKQEQERLQAIAAAFEALYEFHRVEKWCHVHLFYTPAGKYKDFLQHKQSVLEGHASNLFEMLTSSAKLATLDAPALREYTKSVKRFCRNLLDEVEENNALKGKQRSLPGVAASVRSAGVSESKTSS